MSTQLARPAPLPQQQAAAASATPFLGLLNSVIVDPVAGYDFDGAVNKQHAALSWIWMRRDLAPDLVADEALTRDALSAAVPELLNRARTAVARAKASTDAERRLKMQLGGEEPYQRLPILLNALKCRNLLEKAQGFGRAANGMHDDASLATALQAMPLSDVPVAALLMQAAVGQMANPSRLMAAAVRIAGSASEVAIQRAGFAPLVDALLAHAQNQLPLLRQGGTFADVDLVCRAIDRFHRLIRAVHGYAELTRLGRWAMVAAALTKSVTDRVEPKLREIMPDVSRALRQGQAGRERIDPDQMLAALNGIYLLVTVRDSKDSLAVNALFDQVWTQTGQALELYIQRDIDALRANPADVVTSERLDHAIKMAEIRFNTDYAEVLRRSKESALRKGSAN